MTWRAPYKHQERSLDELDPEPYKHQERSLDELDPEPYKHQARSLDELDPEEKLHTTTAAKLPAKQARSSRPSQI